MKLLKKHTKGVAAIEFAIGFFAFWLVCAAFMELSYITYLNGLVSHISAEVARELKKHDLNEEKPTISALFKKIADEQTNLWSEIVVENQFNETIYCMSYANGLTDWKALNSTDKKISVQIDKNSIKKAEITNNPPKFHASDSSCPIFVYSLEYKFKPIFGYFLDGSKIKQEVIAIREQAYVEK